VAKGETVAKLPVSALADFLGSDLEVRKSQVDGKKYPLYLVTPWGPWPINTAKGQDFLLENAIFNGAPVPVIPESVPEVVPESVAELTGANPVDEVQEELPLPVKESGFDRFMSGLGEFD